jgi:hypothetical protein
MQCLDRPLGYAAMIAFLGIALALLRWRTTAALLPVTQMRFDESEASDLMSLRLSRK